MCQRQLRGPHEYCHCSKDLKGALDTSSKSLRVLQKTTVMLIGFQKSKSSLGKATLSCHPTDSLKLQAVPGVMLIVQMKLIDCCRCTMLKKTVGGNLRLVCCLFPGGSRTEYYRIFYFSSQCVSICFSEPFLLSLSEFCLEYLQVSIFPLAPFEPVIEIY